MIISIPSPAVLISSSVTDDSMYFQDLVGGTTPNCWSKEISKGLEVREGDEVYIYTSDTTLKPRKFNSALDVYEIDEVVLDGCTLKRITNKNSTAGVPSVPLEPNEYTGGHESSWSNWETWTKRYLIHTAGNGVHPIVGNLKFDLCWYNHPKQCSGGGWLWVTHDRRANCGGQTFFSQCMKFSSKYDPATDIKADKFLWAAGGYNPPLSKVQSLKMRSLMKRGGHYYFRTWVDIEPEMTAGVDETTTYTLSEVKSPGEIDGFTFHRLINEMNPFDNKNYTKAVDIPDDGMSTWMIEATKDFNTIALGRVIAEFVTIKVFDEEGYIVGSIDSYPIDNSIGSLTAEQAITVALYTTEPHPKAHQVQICLKGAKTELGTIRLGRSVDVGFSNTKFENYYKDFSPREQDQWGNIYYKNGVRVFVYSGTVDMPTSDYDTINRIFMNIGGQEMIINGSDSYYNTPPNSLTIFQSTMMIGRFTSFKQGTKTVGGLMDSIAGYSFTIEESV